MNAHLKSDIEYSCIACPLGAIAGILDENDIFTVLSLYVAEEYRRKGRRSD